MKNIFIKLILATNLIFSYELIIEQDFAKIIYNDIEYESPFLGGFNKPKIQWADWNKDGFVDLFLLDEDGHIRYYINENQNFKLQTTNFLNLSNINWFYIYDFDYDFEYEIITSSYLFPGGVSYFDYLDEDDLNETKNKKVSFSFFKSLIGSSKNSVSSETTNNIKLVDHNLSYYDRDDNSKNLLDILNKKNQ